MSDARFIRRMLPVALSAEEKTKIADCLTAKLTEIDIVESDKREHIAKKNTELKKLREERDRLRANYTTGAEEREVDCIERPGPNGTIELVRVDTGEVVESDDDEDSETADAAETRQPTLPFDRPGKACDGCSNADGTHHPECIVAHPAKADGDPLEDVAPPTPRVSTAFRGVTVDRRELEITEEQAADCAAGKSVFVRDEGGEVEIFRLAKIPQTSTKFRGVDSLGQEWDVTDEDVASIEAGKGAHVNVGGEVVEIASLKAIAADEDDAPAPDYSKAAELAAEQLASGARPEDGVAPKAKKKRGGGAAAAPAGAAE